MLTKEEVEKLREVCKPLVKWLCDNCNPHTKVIVEPTGAEIVVGIASISIEEFIRD